MKNRILLFLMVLVLILAGCGNKNKQETVPTQETAATVAETETTEPTEEMVPGVEVSVFDKDGNVITEPTENKKPEETQAPATTEATKPAGKPTIPTGPSGSKDIEAPDTPDAPDVPASTKPTESVQPTEPVQPTESAKPVVSEQSEYEKFQAMTPAEQQACMESYASIEAFFDWYDQAKAEYDAAHPPIDVGDGNINLDDIIGGNS